MCSDRKQGEHYSHNFNYRIRFDIVELKRLDNNMQNKIYQTRHKGLIFPDLNVIQ